MSTESIACKTAVLMGYLIMQSNAYGVVTVHSDAVKGGVRWDPLNSNTDSFELFVKRGLWVDVTAVMTVVGDSSGPLSDQRHDDDASKATRLAIAMGAIIGSEKSPEES